MRLVVGTTCHMRSEVSQCFDGWGRMRVRAHASQRVSVFPVPWCFPCCSSPQIAKYGPQEEEKANAASEVMTSLKNTGRLSPSSMILSLNWHSWLWARFCVITFLDILACTACGQSNFINPSWNKVTYLAVIMPVSGPQLVRGIWKEELASDKRQLQIQGNDCFHNFPLPKSRLFRLSAFLHSISLTQADKGFGDKKGHAVF